MSEPRLGHGQGPPHTDQRRESGRPRGQAAPSHSVCALTRLDAHRTRARPPRHRCGKRHGGKLLPSGLGRASPQGCPLPHSPEWGDLHASQAGQLARTWGVLCRGMDGTLCGMRLPRSLELRGRNQDRHDSHVPLTRRSKGPCISLLRPQEQSATNWVASCTREAFSHSSEGQNKSEIKVSERGLLLEALRTIFSCLAHFSCCQQSRHPWLADPPLPWLP